MRTSSVDELKRRVMEEWLPAMIAECRQNGHEHDASDVSLHDLELPDEEARSILRAFDEGLFRPERGLRLPRGRGESTFFDHASKADPGPLGKQRLKPYREGFVDIAAASDLHCEYGYPVEELGFQSARWAFDVFVERDGAMLVAGEAKVSSRQLDVLLEGIAACGLGANTTRNLTEPARTRTGSTCAWWRTAPPSCGRSLPAIVERVGSSTGTWR